MAFLITALLVAIAGVVIALVARVDPGYVLMGYHGWTAETTLTVFLAGTLILFTAVYVLVRFLINTVRLPMRLRRWRRQRRQARARRNLTAGLLAMAEGHWGKAEDRLLTHLDDSESPAVNYLVAARAAQKQGAYNRGDDYLNRAHQVQPASELAIGLSHAELQLAFNQVDQALATLTHLRYLAPKHPYVLKLLMQLYYILQDWERLLALLPELHKRKVADYEELEKLERNAYIELMAAAARRKDIHLLQQVWQRVPKDLKGQEPLVQEYVRDLVICGANDEADLLVYQTLRRKWYQPLVYLYGLIDADPSVQLARAEAWLEQHKQDPTLLLTVGRLSVRASLWGKARAYLEASVAIDPKPETYKELGDLLDHLGEKETAMECYRMGLSLVTTTLVKPAAKSAKVISAPVDAHRQPLLAAAQE
jgi:HemY protein